MKRSSKSVMGLIGCLLVAALLAPASVHAAEGKAKVGQAAPDFELKTVSGDKAYKLSDFQGEKPVVLVFQSKDCPWNYMRPEAGYERVLYPMAKEYESKGVQFLAINSNSNESADELTSYVEQHNMPYPLLKDPGNSVADAYGARTTPHFYVIDKEGKLRYMGGYEKVPGNPQQCGEMDEQYLRPVLDALLAGEELPYTETASKGCGIKRQG